MCRPASRFTNIFSPPPAAHHYRSSASGFRRALELYYNYIIAKSFSTSRFVHYSKVLAFFNQANTNAGANVKRMDVIILPLDAKP